jgi:hypothetical protein
LDDDWLTGPERQLRALIRRQRTECSIEQLQVNGQARAQREPRLPPEPTPPPDRLQRELAQQLQRELLPNPEPTQIKRDNNNHRANDDDDNSMPGLLGRDSYDSNAESDDDKEEREFYQQKSGREVKSGEMMDFLEPDEDDE